jgi:hypothetical protein
MLLKRSFEGPSLFRRWVQLYHYRSIHTESISYMPKLVNRHSTPVPKPPQRKERTSSPRLEGRGSPCDLRDERT